MGLKKFKYINKRYCFMMASIFLVIGLLSCMLYFKSYAVFREEKHFNVINGEVQDPGDIYFAYYVDDEITREIPKKGSGYTLDITKSTCTNGVSISFDENNYAVITSYENYNATDYTRTRCDLYFKKLDITLSDYIKSLAMYNSYDLTIDEAGGNIRYIGVNPNNYVSIDGELWRIIGVMKNIDDGTGKKSDRVKLIRNESIGLYSWDSSDSSVNSGWGINEWSQADIMKLLNPGYESESVGGSLYWDSKSGNCYYGQNNQTVACDFSDSGMSDVLKNLIGDAIWSLGSTGWAYDSGYNSYYYKIERGNINGKECTMGDKCNDTIIRNLTWVGKVGLFYLSDYGYAMYDGSFINRANCLNRPLLQWSNSNAVNCVSNNWLRDSISSQWSLTPARDYSDATHSWYVSANGFVNVPDAAWVNGVKPVVYLKPTVKIVSGIGTKENPFVIGN